jgi:hypothetical protein
MKPSSVLAMVYVGLLLSNFLQTCGDSARTPYVLLKIDSLKIEGEI